MKEIATLTVRHEPNEPRLQAQVYRDNSTFYIRIDSDDSRIPPSMPMRINVTNFKDAKAEAGKLLRLVRGVFRQALGKAGLTRMHDRNGTRDACIPTLFGKPTFFRTKLILAQKLAQAHAPHTQKDFAD